MSRSLDIKGRVSSLNSTSTPLNNGEVFTGEWEDVSQFDSVLIATKTDQNGLITIEFSPDGINIDSSLTRYYNTNQIEPPHRFTVTRKYCRIKFTNNSGANQTILRMQVMFKPFTQNLNVPLDSTMSQDYDAIAVRPIDYHAEVALGLRQGSETWNKFGYNSDLAANTPEVLASWGGTFQFLTSGETITITCASANDANGGTGVNSIVVYGVDQNWDYVIEVIPLSGLTPVVTTSQWIGINRVAVFLSGSLMKNDGDITITATSSGYTMALMPVGGSVTQQCIFYVGESYRFLAEWLHFDALKLSGGGGSPEIILKGFVYSAVNNTIQEIYRGELDTANANSLDIRPPVPFPVGEKSILWFEADSNLNNTEVICRFSGELVRDKDA